MLTSADAFLRMLTSLHYDAQVVCLQEVTPRMFQQDLAPLLAGGGGFAGGGGYLGVHSAMEGSDCRSARFFFFFPLNAAGMRLIRMYAYLCVSASCRILMYLCPHAPLGLFWTQQLIRAWRSMT
jgi:hypothetical protein